MKVQEIQVRGNSLHWHGWILRPTPHQLKEFQIKYLLSTAHRLSTSIKSRNSSHSTPFPSASLVTNIRLSPSHIKAKKSQEVPCMVKIGRLACFTTLIVQCRAKFLFYLIRIFAEIKCRRFRFRIWVRAENT